MRRVSKPSLLQRSNEWGRARFDWTKSHCSPEDELHAQSWTHVLGNTGVENVRTTLAKTRPAGSQTGVLIGGAVITKGFAEHWLAWHDRKAKRAGRFHFWIAVGGAAVVVATIAALLTLTGNR